MTWTGWLDRWRRQGAGPAPEPHAPGCTIAGRFRLVQLLGRGAAGEVHQAIDQLDGRTVALKLIRRRGSGPNPGGADDRELVAGRRLRHPGIAGLIDAGSDGGLDWLAMEFAPGVALTRYTDPARLLPEGLVLRIGARIAEALAHAHALGVVHRDLKPSNVRIDLATMGVALLDFGIARIDDGMNTRTGLTLGTPAYMAPEVLAGQPAAEAADVYALGVILYELLAGRRPHDGATLGELLRSVAGHPVPDLGGQCPHLPGAVVDAVHQALRREPKHRPSDLMAYASLLEALSHSCRPPIR